MAGDYETLVTGLETMAAGPATGPLSPLTEALGVAQVLYGAGSLVQHGIGAGRDLAEVEQLLLEQGNLGVDQPSGDNPNPLGPLDPVITVQSGDQPPVLTPLEPSDVVMTPGQVEGQGPPVLPDEQPQAEPEQQAQQEQPAQLEQPVQPEQPEQPTQSKQPAQSEQPEQPEQPTMTVQSGEEPPVSDTARAVRRQHHAGRGGGAGPVGVARRAAADGAGAVGAGGYDYPVW